MDEEDFDLGQTKTRSAKAGRRAARNKPVTESVVADDTQEEQIPLTLTNTNDGEPRNRPSKAVSGWGDEAPRRPRNRQLGEDVGIYEDERLRPRTPEEDDDDNDIPLIPELEDQQEEDMTSAVASAPNVAVNRVATFRELDDDLLRQAAFLTLDNEIDLKLLTKSLSPKEDLVEDDREWDWDRLFTEVTSELVSEWEKNEVREAAEE